jgi:neopullulanase
LLTLHPPEVTGVQFNLIGSHDAPRARTCLAGDVAALRLATLLPLVLPGAPSIYYGDELGMEGGPDPDCRRAYPVAPDGDAVAMRAFTRALVHARRTHLALRRGTVRVVAASGQAVALAREADGERALVAINSGREPARLEIDPALVAGLTPLELPVIAAGRLADASTIELPAQGALVLA